MSVQECHDMNIEHYGECPRCGEYGAEAIGEECFRANFRGDFGTLDVHSREEDGGFNRLICPKSYAYVTRLTRGIAMLVALGDEIPSREMLLGLGRP